MAPYSPLNVQQQRHIAARVQAAIMSPTTSTIMITVVGVAFVMITAFSMASLLGDFLDKTILSGPKMPMVYQPHSQHAVEQGSKLTKRGLVSPTTSELLYNSIGFGIPAYLFFCLRISNRLWVMRNLRSEDYMMIFAMGFYTSLLFFINYSSTYATNLYPPEQAAAIFANPQDVADRIYGSKLVIPLEQSMLASTWLVKMCIWFFISRIADYTIYKKPMRILLWYIIFGYLAIQVSYFAILCKPFSQYWAMPVINPQCTTYEYYSIIQMSFNISSDFGLVCIPLWITHKVQLPLNRKFLVAIPFSMALVTILYYNFASPQTTTYQLWYIRESSVSIWVGNIICTWQLFQKIFKLRTFDSAHAGIQAEASPAWTPRSANWRTKLRNAWSTRGGAGSGATRDMSGSAGTTTTMDTVEREKRDAVGEAREFHNRQRTTTTLMSLRRDDDDATQAIEYRKRFDIS
ncbi:hypothetical protein LSUE1_G000106 [Lachnellula suecica]|uniref:Rhodopsin domain-containing protein n=1 Tax=Lachnellula suecica TaxID=602035 RepID=A0A8T9CK33_9HELO|nr:hypothetical protein LSUE1_G000106 [Lachnellula suecica]